MPEDIIREGAQENDGLEFLGESDKKEAGIGETGEAKEIREEAGTVEQGNLPPETTPERVEGKYQELLSKVTPTKAATPADDDHEDTVVLDAKHIGAMTDEASKVQKLLDLAQTKGVVHAVKVARSLRDYYALDRMHDELASSLYQGLLEQGLITKE